MLPQYVHIQYVYERTVGIVSTKKDNGKLTLPSFSSATDKLNIKLHYYVIICGLLYSEMNMYHYKLHIHPICPHHCTAWKKFYPKIYIIWLTLATLVRQLSIACLDHLYSVIYILFLNNSTFTTCSACSELHILSLSPEG